MKDASKILRAVLWVAVSSQAQAKEGDISLEEQERAMRAWCEAQGAVVVDVLSVPGHSRSEEDILTLIDDYRRQGVSAYDDLRAHWQKRDFDLLLLYDNSRLARSNPLYVWCATCVQSAGAKIYRIVGGWMESGEFQVLLGSVEATAGIKRLVKMRHAKMDEYASRGLPTSSRHNDALIVIRDEKHRMVKMVPDPAPVGWVKGRSRKTGKEKESEALPEGQIRQAIGLRGRIATMPPGAVAGIFAPVAPSDTQRITADQPYQVVNWDMWVYGLHVQGFSMMGRFPFEIGDWIDFSAFGSDAARRVRILEIRQVNGDALTSDDLSLLGYGREEWEAEGVPLRRGWLMRVQVEKEIEGKRPTGEPTIIHEDGKVERITPTDSIDD